MSAQDNDGGLSTTEAMNAEFDDELRECRHDEGAYWRSRGRNTIPGKPTARSLPCTLSDKIGRLERAVGTLERGKAAAIKRGETTDIQDRHIDKINNQIDVMREQQQND